MTLLSSDLIPLAVLVILTVASCIDLVTHRIPNWLSLGGVLIGLSLQIWLFGLGGFMTGLGGMAVGLFLLLPFYAFGGMGAGDVKLMAAAGAFLGWPNALLGVGLSLGVGGVLGMALLVIRGGVRGWLQRYLFSAKCLLITGQFGYVPPEADGVAASRFPYAVAIAAGSVCALWWGGQFEHLMALLEVYRA